MISVLFAARDSIYKTIPGLDVWDEDRNALKWPGGNPGIFHPPCRLFSSALRHFSTAAQREKWLAHWSVIMVREHGGVIEHPAFSKLWDEANLPRPGKEDAAGFTFGLDQFWFGHAARKRTWLYICGTKKLPTYPILLGDPLVQWSDGEKQIKHRDMQRLSHSSRQGTPIEFAKWLISVAELCQTS